MKNNKFLTALLALAIALGLYFYVVTVVKPDTTNTYYNIPVAFTGENILQENGLVIVSGKDTMVTMDLHGNRTDLDKVNSGNITLIADLTSIYAAGEIEVPYSYRFPGDVPSGALTVQSKSPDTIKLKVENRVPNDIPVIVSYVGEMPDPDQYIVVNDPVLKYTDAQADDTETVITAIRVTGPESVISQIHHARVEVDPGAGRTQMCGVECPIILCDEENNAIEHPLVSANITEVFVEQKINYLKRIRLKVVTEEGGGANDQNSSIQYSPAYIQVSGSQSVLSKKTEIILGTVELEKVTEGQQKTFDIVLDEGLVNETGVAKCTVTFRFPTLKTKELSVTKINAVNVPEGMDYELLAKAVQVTVRGPKDVVDKVTPNDITVTIDFSNAVAGTSTFTPVITVNETKYPDVGPVGIYSVGVTLQESVAPVDETVPE